MKNDKEELLRKFLDGELNRSEEQQALHAIADDAELREMLRFERQLVHSLGDEVVRGGESFAVPTGFTESVMQKIEAVHAASEQGETLAGQGRQAASSGGESAALKRFKHIVDKIFAPRQVAFRPVYILVAVMLLWLGQPLFEGKSMDVTHIPETGQVTTQMVAGEQQADEVWVRFVYFDDEAGHMAVAGDFSDWDPVELNSEWVGDKQVWTGMVRAERGEHRYMFVIDGEQWVTDPLAEVQREDGFGNKNAVIYL